MAGFFGCTGLARAAGSRRLMRMALAQNVIGPVARVVTSTSALAVFGSIDASIHVDRESKDTLALAGYVRLGRRALDARGLLQAWQEAGESLLDELRGEFAIAILARGGTAVHVARDHHGSRPVYVGRMKGGGIAFGTSIAPLVHGGVPSDVDHDALVRSLILGYPTAPQTALTQVRQLGPGESWTLAPRGVQRRARYYTPRERIAPARTLAEAARVIDRAVTRAVRDALPQTTANEPTGRVGAFLSGGLDSAIVLARLKESGASVDAYTIYFGDRLPGEIRYARAVAEHLRVPHHVLTLDARAFCDGVNDAVMHLEDVLSEAIAVPNYLLAKQARRDGVSVLFTGEGGDQSFGGPKNIGLAISRAYAGHPAAPPIGDAYARIHQYLASDLEIALTPEVRVAFDERQLFADVADRFFGDLAPRGRDKSFIGGVMVGNTVIKGGNNILPKVAKTIGAAHDLALRCPLFDPRLIDLAFTVPPWQKLRGAYEEKLVLRRAARRSLPREVVDRPKRGMSLPLDAWFDGALGDLAHDVLTQHAVASRGVFRWSYVERLLRREPLPTDLARARSTEKLWLVLVTELHLEALDQMTASARRQVGRAA